MSIGPSTGSFEGVAEDSYQIHGCIGHCCLDEFDATTDIFSCNYEDSLQVMAVMER
jgi:hypothetical protein